MLKKYFRLLPLLALGLGSLPAAAQVDFQPGYIVQPAGDTLRGEVDYRDARFNNNQCRFRATPVALVTTFLPATLRAYGLRDGSKVYRSLVPVALLTPAAPPTPAFLEVLVDGPAQLYSLRDNEGTDRYYVATQAFPLTELVQRKVMLEEEHRLQSQNIYRNTLSQALPSCPAAQALLPSLAFTPQALARALGAYNACQRPAGAAAPAPPAQRQHQRPRLGVVVGAKRTTMQVQVASTGAYYLENATFGGDAAPVGGLSFSLPLTQLSRKLSLELMLLYESQRYSQTLANQYGTRYHFEYDLPSVRLPVLVRYTFPKGRVRPLLEAGPTLAYTLNIKATVASVDASGNVLAAENFLPNNTRQFQQGLSAGVGVQMAYAPGRQATVLVRYEGDTGWAYGQGIATGTNHVLALLALDLFK